MASAKKRLFSNVELVPAPGRAQRFLYHEIGILWSVFASIGNEAQFLQHNCT